MTIYCQFKRYILAIGIAFLIFICFKLFVIPHGGFQAKETWTGFVPILFILAIFGLAFYSAYPKNMALIRKMKTPVIKFRITDEWLYVDSDLSSGRTSWTVYKGLSKNAGLWLVLTPSGSAHVFPVDQLDDELKEFLTAKFAKPPGSAK